MLIPVFCLSQIQINEIFANNENCCLDDFNETEDFIEIINLGDEAIDLAGYYFGDMNSGSQIPDNNPEFTVISPGGLLVLWFDEDPEQGPLHIDAKLSSGGETIFAQNAFGEEVFNISYEPQY